jgi:hypothetical protein
MHEDLTRSISGMIKDPQNIPSCLITGITSLFSKGKDTKDPKNHCLITSPQYIKFLWLP